MSYCVIDFETTGFDPGKSEVIEFAAVRVRGDELGLNIASLCQPEYSPISPKITEITSITPQMVDGKPCFAQLLPTLLDFIGTDTIVCHNVPFDMAFLNYYCNQQKMPIYNKTLCTLALSRRFYRTLQSKKLADVAEHLGVSGEGYHRALADATVTAKILLKMLQREDFQQECDRLCYY